MTVKVVCTLNAKMIKKHDPVSFIFDLTLNRTSVHLCMCTCTVNLIEPASTIDAGTCSDRNQVHRKNRLSKIYPVDQWSKVIKH